MKVRDLKAHFFALSFALTLIFIGCSQKSQDGGSNSTGGAPSEVAEAPKPVTVPAGTEIAVVLDESVSSRDSHSGEEFDATVSRPVILDGRTVIPKDARAKGRVVEALASGRLQSPALLSIALKSVEVASQWEDVATDNVTLRGKSHKKRNIEIIGGGGALGALVGGLAGGGKGAAIGAVAGAGAGTAGAAATGKKNITIPAEAHISFRLRKPLIVQAKD